MYVHAHIQFLRVCVCVCMCALSSRWKCLLSAGVLADISVSERAGENEGRERRKMRKRESRVENPSNQIHHLCVCVCVCVYASVCVIFPASSSCLPSLILSCWSSRLVLPDPISASKYHNQPFVLCFFFFSFFLLTLSLQQER